LAKFAHCLLRGGAPLFKPETLELFTRRKNLPRGHRVLGLGHALEPSQSDNIFIPDRTVTLVTPHIALDRSERELSVTL